MKNHKDCPICKEEVISDASEPMSCALCGMIIDHDNMVLLVRRNDSMYFSFMAVMKNIFLLIKLKT